MTDGTEQPPQPYVIVVGNLMEGVHDVFGPFATETEAREWAHGAGGDDRFGFWFSTALEASFEDEVEGVDC